MAPSLLKLNSTKCFVKAKAIIAIIVCGLFISMVAQNAESNGVGGNQSPGTATATNGSVNPGSNNGGPAPSSLTNHNNRRRIIEPGLNNPNLNNPNHHNNSSGSYGIITNGFGSRAITNGFGYGGTTNGFGSIDKTNRFDGPTNGFVYGGYTNLPYNNRKPFTTDPRVMGNDNLNSTN